MPAVAEYARPASTFVRRIVDTESALQPPGLEERQLHRKADEALEHWVARAEILIGTADLFIEGSGDEDDSFPYVPIPPNRTFYVKTKYVFVGKGTPLPFDWDDD